MGELRLWTLELEFLVESPLEKCQYSMRLDRLQRGSPEPSSLRGSTNPIEQLEINWVLIDIVHFRYFYTVFALRDGCE